MKTTIKNLIATSLTAIVLTTSAFAAPKEDQPKQVTMLSDIKNVSKIKVSGNVELILVQSLNESIKVYDNYYAKNALVQQQNGDLFISSFDTEKLTVVAYVNNLQAVEGTDNAEIKTLGKLNLISLDVKLQSKATADMDLNVVYLNTNVADNANLTLVGKAEDLNAKIGTVAKLNMSQFASESTNIIAKNAIVAKVVAEDESADFISLGK